MTSTSRYLDLVAIVSKHTKAGKRRVRAPRRNIRDILPGGTTLWSPSLTTADQFWQEFDEGLDGWTPLRQLEDQNGPKWRSDTMIKKVPGSQVSSSALKAGWSVRTPIYNYILWKTEIMLPVTSRKSVSDALKDVHDVFGNNMSLNDRPILGRIAKVLRNKLAEDGATQVLLPYPWKKNEVPVGSDTLGIPTCTVSSI